MFLVPIIHLGAIELTDDDENSPTGRELKISHIANSEIINLCSSDDDESLVKALSVNQGCDKSTPVRSQFLHIMLLSKS